MTNIVFIHLKNDYSGSPKILASAIQCLTQCGYQTTLYVGKGGPGALDNTFAQTKRYYYKRVRWRLVNPILYIFSQISLFIHLLRDHRSIGADSLIYINTILPFGASIFAHVTGRRVIYHLHETSVGSAQLLRALKTIAKATASLVVYVSKYHQASIPIAGVAHRVIPNAISDELVRSAAAHHRPRICHRPFTVLMLSSLHDYKGIPEFTALAKHFSTRTDMQFELVLNADAKEINRWKTKNFLWPNLSVRGRSSDVTTFYARADLLLNLSRPDQFIETFGMTILEAMSFGLPVIAPPAGGALELIEHGKEGFLIDSRDVAKIANAIVILASNSALYLEMSKFASRKASHYTEADFQASLLEAVRFTQKNKAHTNQIKARH